ncbi:MAG: hypothetical protein ABJB22_05915, partial [Verrucomicrobiota bacterium]
MRRIRPIATLTVSRHRSPDRRLPQFNPADIFDVRTNQHRHGHRCGREVCYQRDGHKRPNPYVPADRGS